MGFRIKSYFFKKRSGLKKAVALISVLSMLVAAFAPVGVKAAKVSDYVAFVIISDKEIELDIGEEFPLFAVTSTLKKTRWSSSTPSIASVNAQGVVTAKNAGTAKITAKITNADDSCTVRVRKTSIDLVEKSVTLERGDRYKIRWSTSNGHIPTFRSNKSSVASVDDEGNVVAGKPGEAIITLKADKSTQTFKVTVRQPEVTLNKYEINLYRGQKYKLNAVVSSKAPVTWKSKKRSVAMVDEKGEVTAVKHGTAVIVATVDGVTKLCTVNVLRPEITLNRTELHLYVDDVFRLEAEVNTGDFLEWSSSNDRVLDVDCLGTVLALKKGKAYVYAKCDGTKVKCTVYVSEKK